METTKGECIGGFGEKKSNGGCQYYQQDRVYEIGDIAQCVPAQIPGGSYNYLDIFKYDKEMKKWKRVQK